MIGKLDPEENVLSEQNENSRPYPCEGFTIPVLGKLGYYYEQLNWDKDDDIVVEIGGCSISGIDVGEDYNPKWSSPKGTIKYNKDAFIIIKNQSRRDLTKSQPFSEGEFKPAHPHTPNTNKK